MLFAFQLQPLRSCLLFLGCLLFLLPAHAQPADKYFLQNLDNRNGLSNSAINYIYKDADDIIWVATWDGLNRYDGSSFHVFNYSKENDLKSIGNNVIQYITEDKKGNIWISTIEGISRYEKHSGRIYNYFYQQHQRSRISEREFQLAVDTAGTVFCLTQKYGLTRYDAAADSFRVFKFPGSGISKFAFDDSNALWLISHAGTLEKYTWNGQRFIRSQSMAQKVTNFFPLEKQLFFTTTDNQLYQLTDNTAKPILQMKSGLTAMVRYNDHYLLAWSGRGFGVFDKQFRPADFLEQEARQMQNIRITAWALGSEQILWYGTDGNGMIKIFPKTKPFGSIATADADMPYSKPVRAFCEYNGNLWVGTKGSGIIELPNFWQPGSDLTKRNYFLSPGELDNNAVYALKKGRDQLIYIGTDGKGIGVYDTRNRKFHKWASIEGYDKHPEFGSVYAILQDEDNSVWLGTSSYGLIHLKLRLNNNGSISLVFLEQYTFNGDNTGPANDIIYALATGDPDHIWIACRYGGLSLLDKRTRRFKTFKAFTYEGSLSNNDVLSLYNDSHNRIWVGTSYGLNWINQADAAKAEPVFQKLTTENGLPNNTIHAIEEDNAGNIWVTTNKGLAKVQPDKATVSYYQQADGLQSNEFCDGAVWKDSSDHLFIGGTSGFNYFLPQRIRNTSWCPNLLISNIIMGGVSTHGTILRPAANKTLDYTIHRKDGYFDLDAKAISFLNADKCEYAYFLEGYDKVWHYPGTNGKITYSNVLPGHYTFRIKWSNGEGVWTNETALLNLEVQQYFWLTFPAFLVYIIILSFFGYLFYQYRIEHLMRVKEEEIHQGQLGFFTNIAHELQTPLTLIMGSAERFMDKKEKPYFLNIIHQQASRLTYLVQQLLEFRKAEAGFHNNQYSYLHVTDLLNNLTDPFVTLSEQNGIDYQRNIPPDIKAWVDKDKLEKILFNLLSNAFKHGGKKIELSAAENNGQLEIAVSNSGSHIPPDQLDKLFDKFYVAKPGNEKFGTGIGLAFTKQLVTMLQGKITATCVEGWISFKVSLPLTNAGENAQLISDKPSYLYESLTSYRESSISTEENNKRAIIEQLSPDNSRKNILVVEDEPGIRYLLRDILKDHYTIYEAENGKEALDLMANVIPDLIISDIMMPDMDGLTLCNKVKNAPATCQIPFIILSAKGSVEHKTEGYEVGADAYIAKPFHIAHLMVRIRKLLEYRQRMHDLFRNNENITTADMPDTDKEFIQHLVRIIEEKLDEPELNAAILEKELAMSKMQLYRKLKTMTNMTPGEFIKHIRLKHAAHLLTSTQFTVSEIFYRTGFNNQSYFFREFKKRYLCAPNEYRGQQSAKP